MRPHWQGRPIVHEDHAHDLNTRAAIYEFHHKLPRGEAEERAHSDYTKERRLEAAAHHLSGMRAAQGAGFMDEARKHGVMYDLHLTAAGYNPTGPVPPEVKNKAAEADPSQVYRFKAHRADQFALNDKPQEPAPKG